MRGCEQAQESSLTWLPDSVPAQLSALVFVLLHRSVRLFSQGMKKRDAKKIGPLKLAALNGLSLSRLPLPDEGKEVPARATNDERVRTGTVRASGISQLHLTPMQER